ncbi:MAG TPA: prephenate dehydrogenase/arogenate dehydrogenase family protein [Anaerolineae bacterium]|nr:prephenate dehydrogenase/arogenate dehydrogenase family protein [Anaerolineae bacterium]
MARKQVAIVGLDTVGIALALALKRATADLVVVGVDADADRRREASRLGKVDRTDSDFTKGCREATLIILNAPLLQLKEALQMLGKQPPAEAVVLALASVASEPQRWAAKFLPAGLPFLSAHLVLHPDAMAEGEPQANLFHGAVLCLLATVDTQERALAAGSELARAIEARGYFMDAGEHDVLLAMAEGMPGLVAGAVLLAATRSRLWDELIPVGGSIFKQATEPLFDPAIDAGEALIQNRAEVLRQLDVFLEALREVRQLVEAGDSDQLKSVLRSAADQRVTWLAGRPRRPWDDDEARFGPPRELPRFDPITPGWGMSSKKKSK